MRLKAIKILLLLLPVLIGLLLVFNIERRTPQITVVKLIARCQLELYEPPAQPTYSVCLSCPRVDTIRLWPLPMIYPFFEDWHDQPAPPDTKMVQNGTKWDKK